MARSKSAQQFLPRARARVCFFAGRWTGGAHFENSTFREMLYYFFGGRFFRRHMFQRPHVGHKRFQQIASAGVLTPPCHCSMDPVSQKPFERRIAGTASELEEKELGIRICPAVLPRAFALFAGVRPILRGPLFEECVVIYLFIYLFIYLGVYLFIYFSGGGGNFEPPHVGHKRFQQFAFGGVLTPPFRVSFFT